MTKDFTSPEKGLSIDEQLERSSDLKFSGIWYRGRQIHGDSRTYHPTMNDPWCVPGTRWSPEIHDQMKFKRPGGLLSKTIRGHDKLVTPLAMPSDTKGLFVIQRAIWRQRIKGGNEIPSASWLYNDLDRYYEAGLAPVLIWDCYHPQFMSTNGAFPKQKWHTWLSLYDRIAFFTEGEAVIAQALNDIQAQERKASGTEQGPTTSGGSGGMTMGGGGITIF